MSINKNSKMLENKKAQVWFPDFAFALLIILIGIGLYFAIVHNKPTVLDKTSENLVTDAKKISESLMSAGYPSNWTSTNVTRIGILDENMKLKFTKIENLYDIDYEVARRLFGTYNQFFIELCYQNDTIIEVNGMLYYGKKPVETKNIVKVTRISILNKIPVKINIYVWKA